MLAMLLTGAKAALADISALTTTEAANTVGASYRINDSGEIMDFLQEATGYQGFQDTGGAFTAINDPNATDGTLYYGISAIGQILGLLEGAGQHESVDADSASATLTTAGGGTVVIGIDSSGKIVRDFNNRGRAHRHRFNAKIADVPEPNTLPLLAGCLTAFALALRYRVRHPNRW